MHIAIVANGFQEEYMYNLLNNLVHQVDRIDFIGSSLYAKEKLDQRIVFYDLRGNQDENVPIGKKIVRILQYYKRLFRYLSTTKAKLIHIQWLRFHFIEGVIITMVMKSFGKKVVYTAHNALPHHKTGFYYRMTFLILYNIQNEIIVHTAYIKNQIVKYFRINPAKIHIIHHGVYHKEIDNKVTKTHARKTLGLLPTSTVILFFGKIVAYKGFDTLVKSMDLLPKHNRFEVLVAGKISPEYKSEFEVLLKNKIFNNYTLILRYISEQEVELCFRAADITVLPYKEASQSGVLFMSYTYGVPVIVPDIGGFPEDVLVKRTGYVFEADNPKSLAASLLSFEEDWPKSDPSRNTFIKEFAAQNYSWIKSCEKIREVYQAALNKQSSTDYQ